MTTRSSAQSPTEHMILDENGGSGRKDPTPLSTSSYTLPILPCSSEPPTQPAPMIHRGSPVPDHLCPIHFKHRGLVDSRPASLEPPITTATLSQLDFGHLSNNLLLRHDLNFDPNIQYRPTTDSCQGKLRIAEASEYWNAMEAELAEWYANQAYPSNSDLRRCCCAPVVQVQQRGKPPVRLRLTRLPRMFDSVRDILKSILPSQEWTAIDARLDIHLLVQELENKACDFPALIDWLGDLLRRYCAPQRDYLIDSMTSAVQEGVHRANINKLLDGLVQMFGILEGMKLDCANHSIRNLRFGMIDSTVDFEQTDFLHRITQGWDVSRARIWFSQERRERTTPPGLPMLAASITDLIITNSNTLPPTLTLDYVRVRTLQLRLEKMMYQTACRWTFEETLDSLSQGSIPQSSYDDLFARISIITSDEESRCHPLRQTEDVVLEIVREAYKVSSYHRTPTHEDLDFAESNLLYASNPSTNVFNTLQRYLAEDLHQLVGEEVKAVRDKTPVQISNRYASKGSTHLHNVTEQTEMLRCAEQIAHISALHWRVWAPILYNLPDEGHMT